MRDKNDIGEIPPVRRMLHRLSVAVHFSPSVQSWDAFPPVPTSVPLSGPGARPTLGNYEPYLVALLGCLALYLIRSDVHSYDSLMFANAISIGKLDPTVFRPHNLMYLPLAVLFHNILGSIGLYFSPIASGQLLASAFGGATLGVLYSLLASVVKRPVAILLVLFYGCSNSFIFVSTNVEVYTAGTLFVLLVYGQIMRRHFNPYLLGLVWGLSIVAHITNFLLIFPLLSMLALHRERRQLGRLCTAIAVGIGVAGIAYFAVGTLIIGVRTVSEMIGWIVSYAGNQTTYGSWHGSFDGVLGLKRAFVDGPAKGLMIFHLLAIACAFVSLLAFPSRFRRPAVFAFLHFLTYFVFFSWWEPLNIEFWATAILPIPILMALASRTLRHSPIGFAYATLAILPLVIQIDFNSRKVRDTLAEHNDVTMSRARVMSEQLQDQDLVVSFNDPIIFALPLVSVNTPVASIDMMAGATNPSLDLSFEELRGHAIRSRARNGIVYLTADALNPTDDQLLRLSISREEYDKQLARTFGSPSSGSPGIDLIPMSP